MDGDGDDATPRVLLGVDGVTEALVEEEIFQVRLFFEGLHDRVQENGPDDAAGFPDAGDFVEVHAVFENFVGDVEHGHALGVGADF